MKSLWCSMKSRLWPACSLSLACASSQQVHRRFTQMSEFGGPTMGTSYSVKIFEMPSGLEEDAPFLVDQMLRQVNDQMSTYLENSEISRFNHSDSTEWFPVSRELAEVVSYSQTVSQKTGGAFDITVGPLVNAWNFGPDRGVRTVPDAELFAEIVESTGYDKLSVRLEPPALKKTVPELEIDLSAVAKGYAVDRVVALLNERGAKDVFVEIGGEVSAEAKGTVVEGGNQMPDAATNSVLIAHSLNVGGEMTVPWRLGTTVF